MGNISKARWRLVGESVRGASHERSGLPNQDAIGYVPENGLGSAVAMAVSDGHGSSRSFRSDIGANLAVKVALETLQTLLQARLNVGQSTIQHSVEGQLARDLVKRWRMSVEEHLRANPIETADPAVQTGENPFVVYGATLLAVVMTEKYLIYLQIGDGDLIAVSNEGESNRIFARDSQLLGNETTSLCMPEAWREIKVSFQPASAGTPALVIASTDGYSNSFLNDQAFLKVGPDILGMIRTNGIDDVSLKLREWLSEASRMGSGDDITLGLIYRTEANSAAIWNLFKRHSAGADR